MGGPSARAWDPGQGGSQGDLGEIASVAVHVLDGVGQSSIEASSSVPDKESGQPSSAGVEAEARRAILVGDAGAFGGAMVSSPPVEEGGWQRVGKGGQTARSQSLLAEKPQKILKGWSNRGR